jgi:predicted permease
MISHGYWRRTFGGDPDVIGRDLRVNGRPYNIVGVTPEDYTGSLRGFAPDFYAPTMMYDEIDSDTRVILEERASHRFFVKGRLAPGVTTAQAQVAMEQMAEKFREDLGWGDDQGFLLVPRADIIVYPPIDGFIRAAAWLLSAVVGLVLLIACTNLAGFLLARSLDRRKEIAIRLAMGAKRRVLIGQILTETTLMSLVGGLAGIAVASGLLTVLTAADLPLPIPITLDLGMDASVLAFGLAVSVVAGLFLGLVPAFQSTRLDIAPTLKDESAGSGSSRRRLNLRNGLVAAQVAVCLVLLVSAGLFLRSLQEAQSVDPGFGRDPAALLTVAMSPNRYSEDEGRIFMRQLLDRIEQIPGVQSVGITHNMLLRKTGRETMAFRVDGVEPPPERRFHTVDKAYVDPGYFETVGIPILRGRNFNKTDRADTQQVAIVSAAMAERFWPGEDAVGRLIRRGGNAPDLMVVGVARDAKVLDLSESPRSFIYLPYSQSYAALTSIVARTNVDPERTALDMVATARELDPELILWTPTTMERHLGFVLLPFRLSAWIISAFAVLAVALASVGLYGIVSYSVSQRTREVGIRMSLGASVRAVTLMLMGSGMKLVAVGGVVGLGLSYLLSQALSGLLFGIDALDALTFVVAPLIFLIVAAIAAYFAAHRTSRINPVNALRAE